MEFHRVPFLVLYYSLYIKMTLLRCPINYSMYLFADDTNVFLNGKKINTLVDTVHHKLSKLYIWLLANKLTLNVSKSHFIVFHRARHKKRESTY